MPIAPFVVTQLQNKTDRVLELEITSDTIQQKVSMEPHESIDINLPFGRSEDSTYPLGYIITNLLSDAPCKQMTLSYERTEDPLEGVFAEHTKLIRKRFRHYGSLRCDDKRVATFSVSEGQQALYALMIAASFVKVALIDVYSTR